MVDFLEKILSAKKEAVSASKERVSLKDLEGMAAKGGDSFGFLAAVKQENSIAVIAEMKAKSPSAGVLHASYNIEMLAKAYRDGGASALSVLTEGPHFGGELSHIGRAKKAASLPVLRKDFVFDPYQIVEAKAFGADAVLLIADMLDAGLLKELVACAFKANIEPLVEVFMSDAVPAALNSGSKLIGINTRNLRTLEMVPDNVFRLSRLIPLDRVIIAESGIKSPDDMEKLKVVRVSAVLVGESLLRDNEPGKAVQRLVDAGKREAV